MTAVHTDAYQKGRVESSSHSEKSHRSRSRIEGRIEARETVELMFEVVLGILGESGIRVYCWQEESRDGLEAEGQSLKCLLLRHQV